MVDEKFMEILENEEVRQKETVCLIASENIASRDVMNAQGSIFTNKYAEGYPGKRYYAGNKFIDEVEQLAINRACKLFGCEYANVQPHSGSSANMAAYFALLDYKEKIMGLNLSHGGHLTHGSPVNFSGKLYTAVEYFVDENTGLLDYDKIEEIAKKEKPKLIQCGYTAYPRSIDFKRFREIADSVDAYLMADIAHIAGLIAGGSHPSPFPYADIVTATTHKTLRGPRGGLVLMNDEEIYKKVRRAVFPGLQGGPLEHIIAAKAVAFNEALQPSFKEYASQVVLNAKQLAETLKETGYKLVTGGTDTHLMLVDFGPGGMTGKEAQNLLEENNIVCNKNTVPGETRSPFVTSGLRLGTPLVTTRGMKEQDMIKTAGWIGRSLKGENVKQEVKEFAKGFPVEF